MRLLYLLLKSSFLLALIFPRYYKCFTCIVVAAQLKKQSPLEWEQELIPAKEVGLLFEFYCLCKPLRLCWQRVTAGIGCACTRDFADWITLAGGIAMIWHSCYLRTAHQTRDLIIFFLMYTFFNMYFLITYIYIHLCLYFLYCTGRLHQKKGCKIL